MMWLMNNIAELPRKKINTGYSGKKNKLIKCAPDLEGESVSAGWALTILTKLMRIKLMSVVFLDL